MHLGVCECECMCVCVWEHMCLCVRVWMYLKFRLHTMCVYAAEENSGISRAGEQAVTGGAEAGLVDGPRRCHVTQELKAAPAPQRHLLLTEVTCSQNRM